MSRFSNLVVNRGTKFCCIWFSDVDKQKAVKLDKEIITDLCILRCSYMDTEQYEEAVRDYEKVYQTEKTKGENQTTAFSLGV